MKPVPSRLSACQYFVKSTDQSGALSQYPEHDAASEESFGPNHNFPYRSIEATRRKIAVNQLTNAIAEELQENPLKATGTVV